MNIHDSHFSALNNIQQRTRSHLAEHHCGAYTFNDGIGLMKAVSSYVIANPPNIAPRILELGCALGYSAACMAIALPEATIDTIEMDENHITLAKRNFEELNLSHQITIHHGQFDTVIANLNAPYDAVFFDGFAPSLELLKKLYALLNPNGILIIANLGLAFGSDLIKLKQELNHIEHWVRLDSIEKGCTLVFRRV